MNRSEYSVLTKVDEDLFLHIRNTRSGNFAFEYYEKVGEDLKLIEDKNKSQSLINPRPNTATYE